MRKPDAASGAATEASLGRSRDDRPVELVCMALVLALGALALRIMAIW